MMGTFTVVCIEMHYAIGPIKSEVLAIKLALELNAKGECKYAVVETMPYSEEKEGERKRGYL